jgi:hypothetical protein
VPATIASDHDVRNRVVLDYYGERLALEPPLRYLTRKQRRAVRAEWFIVHSVDPGYWPPEHLLVPDSGRYRLQWSYPFAGISGMAWFIYRAEPPPT